MNNLVFMLWILLWPLVTAVANYLYAQTRPPVSDTSRAVASLFDGVVWVFIGALLYQR